MTPAFLSKTTNRLSWALYLEVGDLGDLGDRKSCKVSMDPTGWYHEDDEGPRVGNTAASHLNGLVNESQVSSLQWGIEFLTVVKKIV